MASKASASLAFLLSLNLLFFTFVSACDNCYVPAPPKPKPCPPTKPNPPSNYGKCPKDTLKIGVCAKLLVASSTLPSASPSDPMLHLADREIKSNEIFNVVFDMSKLGQKTCA
ncbi:hypothetical protein Csa_000161 [Cucumis sativus]|nr:hypothetical protein Csa_000161 [Cucumis sativus]